MPSSYNDTPNINDAPTFTLGDGKLLTPIGTHNDNATALTIQPDGKILVAGYSVVGSYTDVSLARYHADGTIDHGFDGDGKIITTVGSGNDYGYSIKLQLDGKILVGGETSSGFEKDFFLLRYQSNGALDPSFSSDGISIIDAGNFWDEGRIVNYQADGKILLAGRSAGFQLVRLNSDGTMDPGFGNSGLASAALTGYGQVTSSILQPDGMILVGGYSNTGSSDDFTLARFDTNGFLDGSFGTNGIVITEFGSPQSNNQIVDLVIVPGGKILAVGWSQNRASDIALARYNMDGSLDASFGVDGRVTTDISSYSQDGANSVVVQPDGKLLVAGYSGSVFTPKFVVVRYLADGSLDTTFGNNGYVITPMTSDGNSASGIALQVDGKFVVVGHAYSSASKNDFALARYNTDGSLDSTFDNIKTDTLDESPLFTLRGSPVQLDSNVQIYDADLATVGNYAGAQLTLARHGGANSVDVFSSSNHLGALSEGGNLSLSGVTIGTVLVNSAGTLSLTFNSAATQAQINEALSSLSYSFISTAPPQTVILDWAFSDGNIAAQGTGGPLSVSGSTIVRLFDPPPPIISITGLNASQNEGNNGGAMVLSFTLNRSGDTTAASSVNWKLSGQGLFPVDESDFNSSLPSGTASFAIGETDKIISISVQGDTQPEYNENLSVSLDNPANATLGSSSTVGIILNDDTWLTGTTANDTLIGTATNDVIIGMEGNDTITGGNGDDILFGEIAATNLSSSSGGGITIIGYTINDVLEGGDGNDILDGGIGDDFMSGGAGNDSYVVTSSADTVIEYFNEGLDTVWSTISYSLTENVENLSIARSANLSGTGNSLENLIIGNDGNNVLDGGSGSDTLIAGVGNDTYVVDICDDQVIEQTGAGIDTVRSYLSWTLGANLEHLTLLGAKRYSATGNALDNTLTGNGLSNILDGGAGADTLIGEAGNDTYVVDNLNDVIQETRTLSTEIDTVRASVSWTLGANLENLVLIGTKTLSGSGNTLDNSLTGNGLANTLNGLEGNDTLAGLAGNDTLTGGAGNDIFVFSTGLNVSSNVDTITDFTSGSDRIQLDSLIFSQMGFTGTPTSDAFFRLGNAAQDADDRILYDQSNGALYYDNDGSGNSAAIRFATLANVPTLLYTDILLV